MLNGKYGVGTKDSFTFVDQQGKIVIDYALLFEGILSDPMILE
jgi:hypothetical protein